MAGEAGLLELGDTLGGDAVLIVITGVRIHSYPQAEFHKARLRARPPVGASGAGLRQGVVGLGDRL